MMIVLAALLAVLPLAVTPPAEGSCPRDLAALVEAQWKTPDTSFVLATECVGVHMPEPRWYVVALRRTHDQASDEDAYAVLRGTVAWPDVSAPTVEKITFFEQRDRSTEEVAAVDFDGDGKDEVVETETTDRRGRSRTRLRVLRLVDGTWRDVGSQPTECVDTYEADFRDRGGLSQRYAIDASIVPDAKGARYHLSHIERTRGRKVGKRLAAEFDDACDAHRAAGYWKP